MRIVNRKTGSSKATINPTARIVLTIFLLVTVSVVTILFFSHSIQSEKQSSIIRGRYEGCVTCHNQMEGFVAAHSTTKIGCAVCHRGDVTTTNKGLAHNAMILIPGNLSDAKKSCGESDCHPGIFERVNFSIMSTLRGMISVDRWVFDESDSLNSFTHVNNLTNSNADTHLKNLCVSCHLGGIKDESGPVTELSRGGGCLACHLNSSESALRELTEKKEEGFLPVYHPSISLEVTSDHCFGCHSRSGRISTNYEGWHETSLAWSEIQDTSKYRLLEDDRVFEFIQSDVHHQRGMECIDCHISYEIMGDGNEYFHKEDHLIVECIDCHSSSLKTKTISQFDFESKKIANIKKLNDAGRKFVITNLGGYPLINTFVDEYNNGWLIPKMNGTKLQLNPPLDVCDVSGSHQNLSCQSCHTAWIPQCIGCHTDYEQDSIGYDNLKKMDVQGEWVEYFGDYYAELPTLGVKEIFDEDGNKIRIIDTFTPGMILTIDTSQVEQSETVNIIFQRLFAPASAHTITGVGRDCMSCHNNPLALGYGRGELVFKNETKSWKFFPKYSLSEIDRLPEDAWIGFLDFPDYHSTTRENMRPLTVEEQKKILTVGVCLSCHEDTSEVILESIKDFKQTMNKCSEQCLFPVW